MSKAADMYISAITTLRKRHESLYTACLAEIQKAADDGEILVDLTIDNPSDLKGIALLVIEDDFKTVRWRNKPTILRVSWRHFNAGPTEGSE